LRELELLQRGGATRLEQDAPTLDADDVEDLEKAPDNEVEAVEEQILDQATAARSAAELKVEIETLGRLEGMAQAVRRGGNDTKRRQLSPLLRQDFAADGFVSSVGEPARPRGSGEIPKPKSSPRQKLVL